MTASEDPALPPSTAAAAAGAAEPRDDLEHWLSDLRTDVAENPSGWIAAEPAGEDPASRPPGTEPVSHGPAPASASGPASVTRPASVTKPASVGRHRSAD